MISVDIILVTYNHEKFVKPAVESILCQHIAPNINVRLIVADDYSKDGTLDIIKNTVANNKISTLFLPSVENLGIVKNYERAFAACNADYVLILEGDDAWTSPNHIEQHVRFLNNHMECSMSMNRYVTYFEDTKEYKYEDREPREIMYYDLSQQILDLNHLGNLSACCFRGKHIKDLPPKLFQVYFADWLLGIIMAQHGLICVFRECTSMYRISSQGLWAGLDKKGREEFLLQSVEEYDEFFERRYHRYFYSLKESLLNVPIWKKILFKWLREIRSFFRNIVKK